LAGAAGLHDDAGDGGGAKGLKGHLAALRRGRVTPGLVKVVVIGLGAGVNALLAPGVGPVRAGWVGRLGRVVLDTALVAGLANLVNLLDLRPGRALKGAAMVAVGSLAGQGAVLAGGVLAAELAVAKGDLGEQTMLGDAGANALGTAVGVAAGRSWPVPVKAVALGGIVLLTLLSERVSFTRVIEANSVLRRIDQWGR
jgi:hypothetical protein